jgi:hypothetical protein
MYEGSDLEDKLLRWIEKFLYSSVFLFPKKYSLYYWTR